MLFRWEIPSGGVQLVADAKGWGAGGSAPEPRALGAALVPQGDGRWPYFPLDEREPLFEALADAAIDESREPPSGESLAQLASKWGLLGVSPELRTTASGREEERDQKLDRGLESVAQWRAELLELRDAFELWGAVSGLAEAQRNRYRGERLEAARAKLAERVRIGDGFVLLDAPLAKRRTRIGNPNSDVERLVREHPSDLLLAGQLALRAVLDERLRRHSRLRMIYDESLGLRLRADLDSLLGAAWYQLAESASGRRKVRSCPRCPNWFVVKSTKRAHDRYCSEACRKSHYRYQARARSLAAEGRGVQRIATTLRQPAWLVREWIGETKSDGKKRRTRKTEE